MARKIKIGLLSKKRGNFALQERFIGAENVTDTTQDEVDHHRQALEAAGYVVRRIRWGPALLKTVKKAAVDLYFNVSSLVEAAILEELKLPYVGSSTGAIALAAHKSLAKRLWQLAGLPTSPFVVVHRPEECEVFRTDPPFDYPLFIKPEGGRGSAGIDETSVVTDYDQLVSGVARRLETMGQPVLIERQLTGREITLGLVGNGEKTRVLPPLEIAYRKGDVTLTFEKKELDDDKFFCPAGFARKDREQMLQLALQAYAVLGMQDFGRIDTLLTADGPMLLEANTFPGLTCTPPDKPHSYFGFMARAEGKDGSALLDEIVRVTIRRLNLG
jgi:D-alanine-D-alanine ligase